MGFMLARFFSVRGPLTLQICAPSRPAPSSLLPSASHLDFPSKASWKGPPRPSSTNLIVTGNCRASRCHLSGGMRQNRNPLKHTMFLLHVSICVISSCKSSPEYCATEFAFPNNSPPRCNTLSTLSIHQSFFPAQCGWPPACGPSTEEQLVAQEHARIIGSNQLL